MTYTIRPMLLFALLAGCGASALPESNPNFSTPGVDIGRGVGINDYESFEARQIASAQGGVASVATTGAPVTGTPAAPVISSEDLRSAGLPAAGDTLPRTGPIAAAPLPAAAAPLPPRPSNGSSISDEQNFEAVSARETIESDAERLARQRAQYTVIQPGALPQRTGASGPNIVQYALSTSNPVGQQIYRRGGLFGTKDPVRACAQYGSADQAQQAFLAEGGPNRDRLGVDPDGDGFACGWDPRPFRAARG